MVTETKSRKKGSHGQSSEISKKKNISGPAMQFLAIVSLLVWLMRRWEKEKEDVAGKTEAVVCWQIGQALNMFPHGAPQDRFKCGQTCVFKIFNEICLSSTEIKVKRPGNQWRKIGSYYYYNSDKMWWDPEIKPRNKRIEKIKEKDPRLSGSANMWTWMLSQVILSLKYKMYLRWAERLMGRECVEEIPQRTLEGISSYFQPMSECSMANMSMFWYIELSFLGQKIDFDYKETLFQEA